MEQGIADPLAERRAVADLDTSALARGATAPATPVSRDADELVAKMRVVAPTAEGDLAPLVKRYSGDAARAWGALYLGADAVDAVVRDKGDGWFAVLPADARDFAAENMAMLGAAASPRIAPPPEERAALRERIEAQPWDAERKARALDELDQRVAAEDKQRKQVATEAKEAAFELTDQLGDGFTSMTQLPAAMRRNLDPEALGALTRQARQNARPEPVELHSKAAYDLTMLAATDRQAFVNKGIYAIKPPNDQPDSVDISFDTGITGTVIYFDPGSDIELLKKW